MRTSAIAPMSEAGPNLSLSQSHARSTRIALSALFGGAVGIGFAPICVRLSELGPSATAFWRLALSLPPLWVWLAIEGQATVAPRRPSCVTDYRRLAVAGLFFAADLAVWHWSITFTSVANATLLANATPIFVTLAAWLWFGQRFTRTFILGMAAAMAGATILAGASPPPEPPASARRCAGPSHGHLLCGVHTRCQRIAGRFLRCNDHDLERGRQCRRAAANHPFVR